MRMLMLHVDYFRCQVTEKGRSKILEEFDQGTTEVNEALVVLASVEKTDEQKPELVATKAITEISKIANQLKVNTVVLHSFAHLFAELSRPEIAINVLKHMQEQLIENGYVVERPPFVWFNTLELKARGHPLSRIARVVSVE